MGNQSLPVGTKGNSKTIVQVQPQLNLIRLFSFHLPPLSSLSLFLSWTFMDFPRQTERLRIKKKEKIGSDFKSFSSQAQNWKEREGYMRV